MSKGGLDPEMIDIGDPGVVERVVNALEAGEVVVLPTDTVYGLVALPTSRAATDRVFALKGRGAAVPMAVLCADVDQALGLAAQPLEPALTRVAERFWPGALTLVLPRRAGVELHLGEPATTIGLRVPDHDLIRAIAARVGPIAATSANRHGQPTGATAGAVVADLGSDLALVVDGGHLGGAASTVIDATERPWRALRDGPLAAAVLEQGATGRA